MPLSLPLISGDPPRVEAVLRNLIENAAKYSPPDSRIAISAEPSDGQLVVRVADEGPGIPLEHRARVFDRFYRVEAGLVRQTSGAGLGLAISKGFVEAHGGHIWIEPSALGAVIAFSLPLAEVPGGARAPAPRRHPEQPPA